MSAYRDIDEETDARVLREENERLLGALAKAHVPRTLFEKAGGPVGIVTTFMAVGLGVYMSLVWQTIAGIAVWALVALWFIFCAAQIISYVVQGRKDSDVRKTLGAMDEENTRDAAKRAVRKIEALERAAREHGYTCPMNQREGT